MQFDKNGWLFPKNQKNEVTEISQEELLNLLELTEMQDKIWHENIENQVRNRNINSLDDFWHDYILMQNAPGTRQLFPFGNLTLTFPSKTHFYRGENQIHRKTIPTLNRKLEAKNEVDQEIYRAIANIRIEMFSDFILQFDIIRYWETEVGDTNFKALAQHYGFETSLLDLTNDFKVALFFATCKYVPETDSYRPLTKQDIEKNNETKYGVIYHAPNWKLDHQNMSEAKLKLSARIMQNAEILETNRTIDSGLFDDVAFQIGYQPLLRCAQQNGYIIPMRNSKPLQENGNFETIHFRQSEELSQKIFELMDNGKKILPSEGITKTRNILDEIKKSKRFYIEDVKNVYNNEVSKKIFPRFEEFKNALLEYDKQIKIEKEEIKYIIEEKLLNNINNQYGNIELKELIDGKIYSRPEHEAYMKEKQKMLKKVDEEGEKATKCVQKKCQKIL